MAINNQIFVIIIMFLLVSCRDTQKEFYTESTYKNGNVQILSKKLKDTLINDSTYNLQFSEIFDISGKLIEKGNFVGNERIGKHSFYNNDKLESIKTYFFISEKDDKFFSDIKIFNDTVVY